MPVSRYAPCLFAFLCSLPLLVAAPRTVQVTVRADSGAAGYEGTNALDGDPETMWHTPWGAAETKLPHELTIDLGTEFPLKGFRYQRRLNGVNGTIGKYVLLVSADGKSWGKAVAEGTFTKQAGADTVMFPAPVRARFVLLSPRFLFFEQETHAAISISRSTSTFPAVITEAVNSFPLRVGT